MHKGIINEKFNYGMLWKFYKDLTPFPLSKDTNYHHDSISRDKA